KVKSVVGGGGGGDGGGNGGSGGDSKLARKVEAIVVRRTMAREVFEPIDIADEATSDVSGRTISVITQASALVEDLFQTGRFDALGYTRTRMGGGNWRYHPKGASASPPAPAPAARASSARAPAAKASPPVAVAVAAPAPAARAVSSKDPLDASAILGLSADEVRKRALRIDPYRTAWIGRVDTIPPQSDERTALIDRGLILRGLLDEKQITEIHRIGDIWLRHHEAVKIAGIAAKQAVDRALADKVAERAAKKAQKKAEAAERLQRRIADVAQRKAEDIVYLGPGVSGLLSDRRSHVEALQERGLPVLSTPADVARAMGIPVPELRWLAYHAEATPKPHYVYFEIPKRSGGTRLLAAPHAKLAAAQEWVLHNVLEKLATEPPAHGFVKGRSTVTCALPHVGRDVVVNLDLSSFFPTIGFGRARGVFRKLGYSPAVATIFALLCTESPRTPVLFEGERQFVAVGPRALPQGACTSPALSNQVVKKLDRRLAGMAAKHGFAYTRYADDLTFSAPPGKREEVAMLLARVRHVVEEEGFAINPKKGRIQRSGRRQSVTGIVVNHKPSVPREEVRLLRSILHHAKTTGLEAQNRAGIPYFESHLRGRIAYVHMVDPARAAPLFEALAAVLGSAAA
ncbi:MAG: reverse transcriptase family protein, partial [Byssovorax sp.]